MADASAWLMNTELPKWRVMPDKKMMRIAAKYENKQGEYR